jgi:hypothetical protein
MQVSLFLITKDPRGKQPGRRPRATPLAAMTKKLYHFTKEA